MKKILSFIMMFIVLIGISACSNQPATNPNINLNPTEHPVEGEKIVTLTINAQVLLNKEVKDKLKPELQSYVPEDGFFAKDVKIGITGDDITVEEVLDAYAKEKDIKLDFTDSSGLKYLSGVNNILGGSTGDMSGWLYIVNNVMPNIGIGDTKIKGNENIVFIYSSDGGNDIKNIIKYTYEQ